MIRMGVIASKISRFSFDWLKLISQITKKDHRLLDVISNCTKL